MNKKAVTRCSWAQGDNPLMTAYHDEEWGVPLHGDRKLFELLSLEGFQAGLNWAIVLAKRPAFRRAFDRFVPAKVAAFDEKRVEALMADAGIVRNRAKILATIGNAKALLAVAKECGSFETFVWSFVGGTPIVNRPKTAAGLPATSPQSDALSKALRERGFRFVGSTICYAFMQAAGLVDDHLAGCFRAPKTVAARRAAPARPKRRTAAR
jgi:DNA-3-methyladenine glycosylase I